MAGDQVISKEEVELYDRQIRLWGMDGQTRLSQGRVLLIGVKAVTLEVGKNLALAGLSRLAINDTSRVTTQDLETQYYMTSDDLGKERGLVLAASLRDLNPRVEILDTSSDDVAGFDLVVSIGKPARYNVELNERCRAGNVKFLLADCFGLFGVIFADCIDHSYVEEAKSNGNVVKTEKSAVFSSLKASLECSFAGHRRLSRQLSPLAIVFQGLYSLHDGDGIPEHAVSRSALNTKCNALAQAKGIDGSWISDDLVARVADSWNTEFLPSAAVVGGILSQEVIKIITCKDLPINNWLVYDGLNGDATACKL